MWVLKLPQNTTRILHVPSTFTIGQSKLQNYQIQDDSLARRHLKIEVTKRNAILTDLSSSGTFFEGKKIKDPFVLNTKRIYNFKLGYNETEINVSYKPISLCFSGITQEDQMYAKKFGLHLGYEITNHVASSTHLVMNSINITKKFLLALLTGKHIVTLGWLKSNFLNKKKNLEVEENKYFPKIVDLRLITIFTQQTLTVFFRRSIRTNIFKNYVFLFFTEDMYFRSHEIVEVGGAKSEFINVKKPTAILDLANFLKLFVEPEKSQATKLCVLDPLININVLIKQILEKYNITFITEIEIVFAIITRQSDHYCLTPQPSQSQSISIRKRSQVSQSKQANDQPSNKN
ncbi:nibrin-related [Anaeramoeba flamelloides]|uniref:Nibrin-related n=1 Tax=Anaeramoeba flamelloides TaxID=1746091 RepID=A0AAV7ZFY8_9EUKA|nr:nibrin-related [Anaeramoeba flamelloides]